MWRLTAYSQFHIRNNNSRPLWKRNEPAIVMSKNNKNNHRRFVICANDSINGRKNADQEWN